jgi:hypothetical protein
MLQAIGNKVWVKLMKAPAEGAIEIFGVDDQAEQNWAEVLSVGPRCSQGLKPGDVVFIEGSFPHIEENAEVRVDENSIMMKMEVKNA